MLSEEIKQALEPDSYLTHMQLSDLEFKITINNMLRALVDEVDNMQEQMSKVSKKKKNQNIKNQKVMIKMEQSVI